MRAERHERGCCAGIRLCLLLFLTLWAPAARAATTRYVSTNSVPDGAYLTWDTAANNIQDAIDVSASGDTVLVSNGVYNAGQGLPSETNIACRVALTNAITVQSVNGAAVTTITGDLTPVRCAYVGTGSWLSGFTLSGGYANPFGATLPQNSGGGVMCEGGTVANCRIINNWAANGGGVMCYNGGTVRNCVIANNTCIAMGGGIYCYNGGTVQNSTIVTNASTGGSGGGIGCDQGGLIQNSIIYHNKAKESSTNCYNVGTGMVYESVCTVPAIAGLNNIANNPSLVSMADYHLKLGSPCIDAGTNQGWMAAASDFEGNLRIINSRVDIGAYEYLYYDILATAEATGAIVPAGTVRVARASSQLFTMTPNPHYHVSNVVVDAVSVGASNSYTFFNVTTSHTISATFAIDQFTLAVTNAHGTATPSGVTVYDYGSTAVCDVAGSPVLNGSTQYVSAGWIGTGSVPPAGATTNVSVTMTDASTLTWIWTTNYWLQPTAGAHGEVSTTGQWCKAETNLSLTAIASNGYHFTGWSGDIITTNNPLVVTMDRPYAVTANFAINIYDILATSGTHGTVAPTGLVQVAFGDTTNFAIIPDAYYHIEDVQVDSVSIGVTNAYTFVDVASNHFIHATFAINTYTVAVETVYGTATPSGTNLFPYGTNLDCSIGSPVTSGTTQYVGAGWIGTGSIPASGGGTNFTAVITNDSTLTWLWSTNYWLRSAAGPDGSVNPGDGWYTAGASVVITATPALRATFVGWSGDVTAVNSNDNPLTLYLDAPRSVTANFVITTHYVSTNGGHVDPFTSWATAATNIQSAVDACENGARVLVSNGVYALGAPVTITNGIRIDSVNGAGVTTLDGQNLTACLYSDHATNVIDGFTIIRGWGTNGGGATLRGGVLRNCSITLNTATNGGGVSLASGALMYNCIVWENTGALGGGVYVGDSGTLQNCTIVSNAASTAGGGVYGAVTSTVRNCIVYFNSATNGTNTALSGTVACTYSCSTPLQAGAGNLATDPQLTPLFHLKAPSPCVDAGVTNGAPAADIDGEARWDDPRRAGGVSIVDIGADEFVDTDLDSMADLWEMQQFGSLATSSGATDGDADSLTDLQEYNNAMCPTNRTTYDDSIYDAWKVAYGFTKPHVLSFVILTNGVADSDRDGMPDSWELAWFGNLSQGTTNDSDIDAVSTWGEYLIGINPTAGDTDGDGLNDGAEINTYLTDPRLSDTDGDGSTDGAEVAASTDPRNPASFPATIAGNISYTGSLTGVIRISVTNGGYATSTVVASPGGYAISNNPTLTNYWIRAYRDSNGNGLQDTWEAAGSYSNNPVYLTNHTAVIHIALVDPMFSYVVAGSPLALGGPLPFGYTSNTLVSFTVVTNEVEAAVVNGTTQYVCLGWTGTGSVPASGAATNVTVTVTNHSKLTWNWMVTNVFLNVQATTNGSVSGTSGWYAVNSTVTNVVTPSNGYHFAGWTGDVPPANTNDTTLALTLDRARAIQANFSINVYDVTSSAGVNGSVTPEGVMKVPYGGSTGFTITPALHYHVEDVQVDSVSIGPTNSYTFSNVTSNHDLHADFAIDMYDITATGGAHGSVAPVGVIAVPYGGGTNFVFLPDLHYYVQDVVVDGVSVGAPTNYLFSGVTNNHSLDVAFDDRYRLVVISPWGTAAPAGTNLYRYGTTVDCAIVDSPVTFGATQYTCLGWSGTGSVTPSGTTTGLMVVVTNDSTLSWLWATSYWMNATSGPDGSIDASNGWYSACSNVTLTATASNHYHLAGWTGTLASMNNPLVVTMGQAHSLTANFTIDTYAITAGTGANGSIVPSGVVQVPYNADTNFVIEPNANYHVTNVVVDGVSVGVTNSYTFTGVTNPHTISATFGIDMYSLVIASAYGTATPAVGTNLYGWNTALSCMVGGSPVTSGTTQYLCTGWTGTGSAPLSGATTNTGMFFFRTNSAVTWNWQTRYRLTATNGPFGRVTVSNGWYPAGTPNVMVTAIPSNTYHLVNWTGDLVTTNNPLSLTMDQPYALTANFALNTYDITATAGPNGTISPSGTVTVAHGGTTNFTITPTANYLITNVVVDGVSQGATNSYRFLNVTNAHTISATFVVSKSSLVVTSPYGTPSPARGTNVLDWNSAQVCSMGGTPALNGTTQYVCTGWTGTGSVPSPGAGTTVGFTITNNSAIAWAWRTNYWLAGASGANGTVTVSNGWYASGASATLTAVPSAGYAFAGWSGDVTGVNSNDNPLVLTMSRPRSLTASFTISPYYVALGGKHVYPFTSWETAATNIQAAVDAAPVGRTVMVSNGTYMLTAPVMVTNGVIVRSLNGSASTTVDGNRTVRCFIISNSNAIVSGFTITHGNTTLNGGGVLINGAGSLQDCAVRFNAAGNYGGGVYLNGGGVVQGCTIQGNSSVYGGGVQCENAGLVTNSILTGNAATYGGGLRLRNGGLAIGCGISNNTATSGGGGVQFFGAGLVKGCGIGANSAGSGYGGGIYCYTGGTADTCVVSGNTAYYGAGAQCELGGVVQGSLLSGNTATYGGGLRCKQGGTAQNCVIVSNTATGGGGVQQASAGVVRNSFIAYNRATSVGGGLYLYQGGSSVNCTIIGNTATTSGGGAYCEAGGQVDNTILYFNQAATGTNWANSGSGMSYTRNCSLPLPAGTGNTAGDPVFLNRSGGDYRLQFMSPCINAGANAAWMTTAVDLDGNPRILNSVVDMGAYEWLDTDGDGLSDLEETRFYGTNPGLFDSDGDSMPDGGEVVAGTSPTNSGQFMSIDQALTGGGSVMVLYWDSITGRLYTVKNATNLLGSAWTNVIGCVDLPGNGGVMGVTNSATGRVGFFRVNVRLSGP